MYYLVKFKPKDRIDTNFWYGYKSDLEYRSLENYPILVSEPSCVGDLNDINFDYPVNFEDILIIESGSYNQHAINKNDVTILKKFKLA